MVGYSTMKVELLKNSFRGATRHEEAALAALAIVPRKRRVLPVAASHFDEVNKTVLTSNDDLILHAASTFDPRRMTRMQAQSFIELLEDGEFLSCHDVQQLSSALNQIAMSNPTLDFYKFVQLSLPISAAKGHIISVLDDVIAQRCCAVS